MDITKLDSNFKISANMEREGLKFINCLEAPFRIYGVRHEDGAFLRMDRTVADGINNRISELNRCTAGGRIEFSTDSPYIALHAELISPRIMNHFAVSGSVGCDLYRREGSENVYLGSFIPKPDIANSPVLEGIIDLPAPAESTGKVFSYTLNLPTYTGVAGLYIGLAKDAALFAPADYRIQKPVVFYGSSITQGGCTSRPGCSYAAILSRALDFDYMNLGFSGNARAEDEMSDYISSLDMSVFVFDYDYNAPDCDYLEKTHERFFRTIRKRQPGLPVIIMSKPKYRQNLEDIRRKEIIRQTYENAINAGDSHVYFVPGEELIPHEMADIALVDNVHPNDAGFFSMARALLPVLEGCLKLIG